VDKAAIQAQVADLLNPKPAATSASTSGTQPQQAAPAPASTQVPDAAQAGPAQAGPAQAGPAQGAQAKGSQAQAAPQQAAPPAASPSPSSTFDAGDWADALVGGGVRCVK
jgi:hypothetical protein